MRSSIVTNYLLQVPETVDRSRRGDGPTGESSRRKRARLLPSVLPGEDTFVSQSQQVALSSTVAEVTNIVRSSSFGLELHLVMSNSYILYQIVISSPCNK